MQIYPKNSQDFFQIAQTLLVLHTLMAVWVATPLVYRILITEPHRTSQLDPPAFLE